MAYYKRMCESCKYSSKSCGSPFGGWCDKYNKPINRVGYENSECLEKLTKVIKEIK